MGHYRQWIDSLFATRRFHFLVIAVFSSLLLFGRLHQGDLSGYDDALYAHEGKQMVLTGDWWTIYRNGYINFENPPLFIWMEAISLRLFGITDFAAKFPSALLGLGTILLVYLLTRELTESFWLPILAMFVMMGTQYFMKYATHAMTDIPFTFFFTLALFLYVKGLKQPVYLLLCGVPIGLGILTRSVIGLIPMAIIIAHLLLNGRYRMLWSGYLIGGFLLALLLPFLWYLPQYRRFGDIFLAGHFSFIMSKASSGSRTLGQQLYGYTKYPRLLFELYWPWLPLMAMGLWMQIQVMYRRKDLLASLLVVWVLLVVIPLSFAGAKVLRYIMPAFPAFSVLAAIPLLRWLSPARITQGLKIIYPLGFILILLSMTPRLSGSLLRAKDIRALAPVAEEYTHAGERILLYTEGQLHWNYQNQFIWYANRYCDLLSDLEEVRSRLQSGSYRLVIIDKTGYRQLVSHLGMDSQILSASDNFICISVRPSAKPDP